MESPKHNAPARQASTIDRPSHDGPLYKQTDTESDVGKKYHDENSVPDLFQRTIVSSRQHLKGSTSILYMQEYCQLCIYIYNIIYEL